MGDLYNRSGQAPLRQHLRSNGTRAEALLWPLLKNGQAGGHRFRRQFGVSPYILDFYCARVRLGVELDGGVHEKQHDYDAARTLHLEAVGIRVVRFSNRMVFEAPGAVVAAIIAAAEPPGRTRA